jgi:hypothetical protein
MKRKVQPSVFSWDSKLLEVGLWLHVCAEYSRKLIDLKEINIRFMIL